MILRTVDVGALNAARMSGRYICDDHIRQLAVIGLTGRQDSTVIVVIVAAANDLTLNANINV